MKKTIPLLLVVAIVIGVAIYFGMFTDTQGTSIQAQTDFEIADTASVGKIFIADTHGRTATIAREPGGRWSVNGKYTARPDAVSTILATLKNIYVQRPVSKGALEQTTRIMAGSSKKVEFYDNEGEWLKTWYVGHATMDKKGTNMLLETPRWGKSTTPYIMDMKGFIGMLNTRFFTSEEEWRSVIILKYDELTISDLKVDYPNNPDQSFRITYEGGNDISLYAKDSNAPFQTFDSTLVKDYLSNFKLASFENFRTGLTPEQTDSVMASVPYQVLTITDPKQTRVITLWPKKAPEGQFKEEGQEDSEVDIERIYVATEDGELALGQRFVWDKFRAPLDAFVEKN